MSNLRKKYGVFDGRFLALASGPKMEVPENYASKSRLVQGDMLTAFIGTGSVRFARTQPAERKTCEGTATVDGNGIVKIDIDGRLYSVLSASVRYHDIHIGDTVMVTVPVDTWVDPYCAIERII